MIDENADKIFADRFVHKRCRNGGIHPARHGAKHFFIAELFFEKRDLFADEVLHRPIACGSAHAVEEIFQKIVAVFGMNDFGVKLYAVYAFILVSEQRDGTGRRTCKHLESCGNFADEIGMAHPANARLRNSFRKQTFLCKGKFALAILPFFGVLHFAVQSMRNKLRAVTYPQNRDPQIEYLF